MRRINKEIYREELQKFDIISFNGEEECLVTHLFPKEDTRDFRVSTLSEGISVVITKDEKPPKMIFKGVMSRTITGVTLDSLKPSEKFTEEVEGEKWMVTDRGQGVICVCVNLNTGILKSFHSRNIVFPIDELEGDIS